MRKTLCSFSRVMVHRGDTLPSGENTGRLLAPIVIFSFKGEAAETCQPVAVVHAQQQAAGDNLDPHRLVFLDGV